MSTTESTQELASTIEITSHELQAKEAFSQHRLRDCVQQINQILSLDPNNDVARTLQASVREELDGLLNEVRALIEEREDVGSLQGRLCGAEVLLRKVLDIDPSHKGANTLLHATHSMARKADPPPVPVSKSPEMMPFTVGTGPAKKKQENGTGAYKAVAFALAVLAVGGFVFARQKFSRSAQPVEAASLTPKPVPSVATPIPVQSPVPSAMPAVATAQPAVQALAATTPPPTVARTPASTVVVTAKPDPVAPMQFGWIAISSPVATDVYSGEQLLGSTPLTLQLPAGNQTLEFRHAGIRKSVTQLIKADETTTTLVTFDVVVQVNAKPWANVFLEGSDRQALGQTPLSDVHVPIGRVLIFENPKFPSKSYRVTGKESAIQIVFP